MTWKSLCTRLRAGVVATMLVAISVATWATPSQAQDDEGGGQATGDPVVLFVVDLSGSMNEPFGDGRTKLDVAKAGFGVALDELSVPVGLRVYGDQLPSRAPAARQENCENDTRLIAPIAEGNEQELIDQVNGFTAQGDTPIALALEEAANNDIPEGSLATMVLFSDGRDECHDADLDGDPNVGPSWGPDPCDVARTIAEQGVDLRIDKINTIGFQAGDAEDQLRCISGETGGEHRNVETEEDVRDALIELGSPRTAVRLGGDPIEGTPTDERAPTLERIAPGENDRRYTDTIAMNEERWYLAPEYGPGGGHTTVTFFGLPKEADVIDGISMELRWEPGPDENLSLDINQTAGPDPISASDSLRCGGCHIRSSESHAVYWVVALTSEDPSIGGEFDIELLLQDSAWGGPAQGCLEGNRCWYESQIDAAEERKTQLEEQLRGPEELRSLQDEIADLDAELTSLQSQRDGLEAGPEESTNWLLPILLGAVAVLGAAGWVVLGRGRPPVAPATSVATSDGPGAGVIGTIDLGGADAADHGSLTTGPPDAGTGGEAAGEATVGAEFGEPGREVPEADAPTVVPGREVPEAASAEPQETGDAAHPGVSAPTEMPTEATPAIPAAWFDDPHDPGQMRWWDGTAWTDHVVRKE